MEKCTVVFNPAKKSIIVKKGANLLEVARKAGIFIDAPCGGKGNCGKCRVRVVSGEHRMEFTSLLKEEELKNGIRLACLTFVEGDMVVELQHVDVVEGIFVEDIKPGDEKSERIEKACKMLMEQGFKRDSGAFSAYLELPPPTLDDNVADLERLKRELRKKYGINDPMFSLNVMKKVSAKLREGDFRVRGLILKDKSSYEVLGLDGFYTDGIYGICADIGTTTVAVNLVDLNTGEIIAFASSANLQIQYGGDVISRIIYSGEEGGLDRLRKSIVDGTINPLINKITLKNNIKKENIVLCVFAGNTTMSHLFLGIDPANIRIEPYIPVFKECPELKAKDVGINVNPEAKVILLPNVASYVGGDIVSGILASGIWTQDKNILFLDLGTNGEIVLGNRDYLLTCACSAGPAFEGGEISCGMRAAPGAIESIKIDRETFEPSINVLGGKKPKGVCGSGLIDLIAEMFLSGIIDSKGKISREVPSDRIRYDEDLDVMEYVLVRDKDSYDGRDITINEIDIDNLLRAKAAVYSGLSVLLNSAGLTLQDVDKIIIAGGVGSNLHIRNAINIGLLPDVEESKYYYMGNASLIGSYLCLLFLEARDKAKEISDSMTYIELSTFPSYMEEFIKACFIPHTDLNLFPGVVSLLEKVKRR
ncbi:corrinoid activation/regeneration protein AcsV [Thermovenabulum sp.]|uniref:corrinoid activation/regeneration protein AcsV n=1 Tax=Thermovenabulum sp. TaxID=3100335 RepID=UPI003C79B3E8